MQYHHQMISPIQTQPQLPPKFPPMIPIKPGLLRLAAVDRLVVKQKVEIAEVLTGFEGANRYVVQDACGEILFHASEESDFCDRQFCDSRRGFVLHVVNEHGVEAIRVTRRFKIRSNSCFACLGPFQDECTVEAPPGTPIAFIRQTPSWNRICLRIEQPEGRPLFDIKGQTMTFCRFDKKFRVREFGTKAETGKITKNYRFRKDFFTKADNFTINFPLRLDIRMKAAMLGALFLVDFMAFED